MIAIISSIPLKLKTITGGKNEIFSGNSTSFDFALHRP